MHYHADDCRCGGQQPKLAQKNQHTGRCLPRSRVKCDTPCNVLPHQPEQRTKHDLAEDQEKTRHQNKAKGKTSSKKKKKSAKSLVPAEGTPPKPPAKKKKKSKKSKVKDSNAFDEVMNPMSFVEEDDDDDDDAR